MYHIYDSLAAMIVQLDAFQVRHPVYWTFYAVHLPWNSQYLIDEGLQCCDEQNWGIILILDNHSIPLIKLLVARLIGKSGVWPPSCTRLSPSWDRWLIPFNSDWSTGSIGVALLEKHWPSPQRISRIDFTTLLELSALSTQCAGVIVQDGWLPDPSLDITSVRVYFNRFGRTSWHFTSLLNIFHWQLSPLRQGSKRSTVGRKG